MLNRKNPSKNKIPVEIAPIANAQNQYPTFCSKHLYFIFYSITLMEI
jgi:hypothetical protein